MDTERANTITLYLLEEAIFYHRWIFEKVKPYLKGHILEVGCGIGNLTVWLLRQGRVTIADVKEEYLHIVQNKFRDHPNLIGTLLWDIQKEFPKELYASFDTIICSNVLEHIQDDQSVLKNFYRLLPSGGRLILLVPALKILYNPLDRELGHFRRYGRKELSQKFILNGFKICHLTYFNIFGILGWFFNGTLLRRRLLPVRQIEIFNRMVPFFIWVEKVIPKWIGQSLIAVGEKL